MKIICDNEEQYNMAAMKITEMYDGKIVSANNTIIPAYIELVFNDSVEELKIKRGMVGKLSKCCELNVIRLNK